jgi:hypothetical protein
MTLPRKPPTQSDFVKMARDLHAAVLHADTEGQRLQAEAELAEFFRASAGGRLQAWFDARAAAARNEE